MATRVSVAKEYTHIQSTASSTWDIDYKIDMTPVVDVYILNNGLKEKIIPMSIERITNSSLRISFSQPYSGEAHLIG